MPDDLLTGIGSGAGGGLLGVLLGWFGLRNKITETNARITRMEDKMVWRDTCIATHKSIDETMKRMEEKLDRLIEKR